MNEFKMQPGIDFNMSMHLNKHGGCRGGDDMVIGFMTTYAISAYHY